MKKQHKNRNSNNQNVTPEDACGYSKPRLLSNRDRDMVLDLILNPPKPNKELVDLVRNNFQYFFK